MNLEDKDNSSTLITAIDEFINRSQELPKKDSDSIDTASSSSDNTGTSDTLTNNIDEGDKDLAKLAYADEEENITPPQQTEELTVNDLFRLFEKEKIHNDEDGMLTIDVPTDEALDQLRSEMIAFMNQHESDPEIVKPEEEENGIWKVPASIYDELKPAYDEYRKTLSTPPPETQLMGFEAVLKALEPDIQTDRDDDGDLVVQDTEV